MFPYCRSKTKNEREVPTPRKHKFNRRKRYTISLRIKPECLFTIDKSSWLWNFHHRNYTDWKVDRRYLTARQRDDAFKRIRKSHFIRYFPELEYRADADPDR